jgi:hypothetical protein
MSVSSILGVKRTQLDVVLARQTTADNERMTSKADYRNVKNKLRIACSQRRIRLEEFMKTFDIHKTKKISTEQFCRAIDASGIQLTKGEIELLLAKYRLKEDHLLVDYRRFCDLIDKSCTVKDMEKKLKTTPSLETVNPSQMAKFVKQSLTSVVDQEALRSIISKLSTAVRIKVAYIIYL